MLDPMEHPQRWESLVAGIVDAASWELARRRAQADLPALLLQWARPALAAAASVVLLVTAGAMIARGGPSSEPDGARVASALVPESYAAWLEADYEPTVTELVVALEEIGR